jgi:O-antigen/teichoic acid export membrane protein
LLLVVGACLGVITLETLLPLVVGKAFAPAANALLPVLAMLPLIPLAAIATPALSLRLRPGVALAIDGIAVVAFVGTALVAMPRFAAAGATAALLIALMTSGVLAVLMLPQVASRRLLMSGVAGAALVLVLGAVTRGTW